MSKDHQIPLNVEGQITNLKELKLKIDDEEYAKSFLDDVSYFRLIKAFSIGIKPKNGDYNGETTFENIVNLYLFNANFRQLLFSEIERVEVNLRCRIANYFSCMYGVLGYEDPANFASKQYHNEFLSDIKEEIHRNFRSPFVKNFRDNYTDGKLPFYALIELFSFGTLSKFYKNLINPDKKAIAQTYNVGYTYLESWIENIASVRNICAHYGRLYNARLPKSPILYKQYSGAGIKNNRVFATLLCLKHTVGISDHWVTFVHGIDSLFEKYEEVDKTSMGFPDDWKNYLLK